MVLVDDHSDDNTVAIARAVGDPRLKVVQTAEHRTLGFARQTALQHVDTPWLMWVDADDEALPGRVSAMRDEALCAAADIVFDQAELFDGEVGEKMSDLRVPGFLKRDLTFSRQYERNFIPSLGWGFARTSIAQEIGYDEQAHGVEDFDFCLRAVARGVKFAVCENVGYRQFHYATSVSRAIYDRRSDLSRVYAKHNDDDIERRVLAGGWSDRVADWVLVAVNVYRKELRHALARVDRMGAGTSEVLEQDGPCPVSEAWRIAFQKGTLLAQMEQPEAALDWLERASDIDPSADVLNNRGVAQRMLGLEEAARDSFGAALQVFPGFVDAKNNRDDPGSLRITPLPLRRLIVRDRY